MRGHVGELFEICIRTRQLYCTTRKGAGRLAQLSLDLLLRSDVADDGGEALGTALRRGWARMTCETQISCPSRRRTAVSPLQDPERFAAGMPVRVTSSAAQGGWNPTIGVPDGSTTIATPPRGAVSARLVGLASHQKRCSCIMQLPAPSNKPTTRTGLVSISRPRHDRQGVRHADHDLYAH